MVGPRQYDIVANPVPGAAKTRPYLLVLQHRFLDSMSTRLIAPLVAENSFRQIPRLMPQFEIEGRTVFLSPMEVAVFPVEKLKDPISNVSAARDAIIAALDLVFTGP